MHIERQIEINEARHFRANDRYLDMLDRTQEACEKLTGVLIRDGKEIFYINLAKRDGTPTGKVKEFIYKIDAHDYLRRNRYV